MSYPSYSPLSTTVYRYKITWRILNRSPNKHKNIALKDIVFSKTANPVSKMFISFSGRCWFGSEVFIWTNQWETC